MLALSCVLFGGYKNVEGNKNGGDMGDDDEGNLVM